MAAYRFTTSLCLLNHTPGTKGIESCKERFRKDFAGGFFCSPIKTIRPAERFRFYGHGLLSFEFFAFLFTLSFCYRFLPSFHYLLSEHTMSDRLILTEGD